MLEKKSISITRLKHEYRGGGSFPAAALKRKASRLRDWNEVEGCYNTPRPKDLEKKSISITRLKLEEIRVTPDITTTNLKRKASRLRDWNFDCCILVSENIALAWKEKHLDYEIETLFDLVSVFNRDNLKRKASRLRDWNLKAIPLGYHVRELEKKSISITRLKLKRSVWSDCYSRTWKEKHLDYEIETTPVSVFVFV